ncbi:hypothetical protein DPEC_G00193770 [Dallia pectoralis]|uniref:Uncharacterized protein n=1 Tax=Dallia pectoralis TaxID=75939 RepID=A0ACC2G747_DALPE|nr:hypothetical protein DPEC_G00193770 [Dallia pectoralis]
MTSYPSAMDTSLLDVQDSGSSSLFDWDVLLKQTYDSCIPVSDLSDPGGTGLDLSLYGGQDAPCCFIRPVAATTTAAVTQETIQQQQQTLRLPAQVTPSTSCPKRSRSRYPGKKRQSASDREKLRMRDLTKALHHLRTYLPPSVAPVGQTLTKIEILRLTIGYISSLSEKLELPEREALRHQNQIVCETQSVLYNTSPAPYYTQEVTSPAPYNTPEILQERADSDRKDREETRGEESCLQLLVVECLVMVVSLVLSWEPVVMEVTVVSQLSRSTKT